MLLRVPAVILAPHALLLLAGCGGSQPPAVLQTDSSLIPEDQLDLDNVAICFHESVTMLQTEPQGQEDLAVFMKHAMTAIDESELDSGEADFNALRWNPDGTSLTTKSGKRIRTRATFPTHDSVDPQGSEWLREYEFYVPESAKTSRATLRLAMPHLQDQ